MPWLWLLLAACPPQAPDGEKGAPQAEKACEWSVSTRDLRPNLVGLVDGLELARDETARRLTLTWTTGLEQGTAVEVAAGCLKQPGEPSPWGVHQVAVEEDGRVRAPSMEAQAGSTWASDTCFAWLRVPVAGPLEDMIRQAALAGGAPIGHSPDGDWVRAEARFAPPSCGSSPGTGSSPLPSSTPRPPDLETVLPLVLGQPNRGSRRGMVRIDAAPPLGPFWIDAYEYPNTPGQVPRHGVTLLEAIAGCAREGKSLCTAARWRRACQGPQGLRYGYGDQVEMGRCGQVPGGSPHTSLLDVDAGVGPSGASPTCATPEGVHDLIGNAEEWVLDDWRGVGGMLEGGAAYTYDAYADCTGDYSRSPDYRLRADQVVPSAGFRCCASDRPLERSDLALDRERRLAAATSSPDPPAYDGTAEVEVYPGLFMDRYEYPNVAGARPRTAVPWTQARDACADAGKRLCAVHEWEAACGGPDGWPYPYGPRYVKGACATEVDQGPTPSGTFAACTSAAGVQDLVGSVWEWTQDPVDAPILASGDGSRLREIRGGSWANETIKANCAPADGYPAAPEDTPFPEVGFRCCRGERQDREPSRAWPAAVSCPEDMVAVGRSCVDRYEHPNVAGALPTRGLLFDQARAACEAAGKRVCRESEWALACGGPANRGWPYGDSYRTACGSDRGAGGAVVPSGSHTACVTPEGIGDLSGNAWEWVQASGGGGVLRGGGPSLSAGLGRCRTRSALAPTSTQDLGVRCCLTPEAP